MIPTNEANMLQECEAESPSSRQREGCSAGPKAKDLDIQATRTATQPCGEALVEHLPMAWYGARVRSRSELPVAARLSAKDVECFVPCWLQRRAYSDRSRDISVAVFPGYIFCKIRPHDRSRVLSTEGVQSLAGTRQCPEAIEDETILALQKAFLRSDRVTQIPYLRCGESVRVLDGPMTGARGFLVRNKGKQRLVISLHFLQRSVEVEVDEASVMSLP